MKKILLLTFTALFLVSGWAMAFTYTFEDNLKYWPNYDPAIYPDPGNNNGADVIGDPSVIKMYVTVNDATRVLETVEIEIEERVLFDSLFINQDSSLSAGDWEDWDYFVMDEGAVHPGFATGLYSVADNYNYTYTDAGREGHVNGISLDSLIFLQNQDAFITYVSNILTYDFTKLSVSIVLGENFAIGYTPWCANDVMIGSPVPEPATMLLLGVGLLGIARITRRKRS